MPDQPKYGILWLRALPYILFLCLVFSVFSLTPDDPFITFRYAANTLAGHGPVFNVGEKVEGFSSPLHLLESILLLGLLPYIDILVLAKLAGLLCALVVLYQTARIAKLAGLSPIETVFAQILLALNLNFAASAVNGLETTLYAMLLILTIHQFIIEAESGKGFGSGFLAFLALATRPDAILVCLALTGLRLFWMRRHRFPMPWFSRWLTAFLTLAVCLELARLGYYHTPLPNTYYAKNVPLAYGMAEGVRYLARPLYLKTHDLMHGLGLPARLYVTGCIPVFWVLAGLGAWRVRQQKPGQVCIAVCLAIILFVLKSGGDWMLGWRFMVPALPMLAVVQCFGIRTIVQRGRLSRPSDLKSGSVTLLPTPSRKQALLFAAVAVFWAIAAIISPHGSWASAHFSLHGEELLANGSQFESDNGRQLVDVATYIRDTFPPGTRLVYTEMGYAPFLNLDKRFLDREGLLNYEIARLPNAYRTHTGVQVKSWYLPTSPMYNIIQRANPDVIIGPEEAPPVIFGNYREAPEQLHIPFAKFYIRDSPKNGA